MLEYNNWKDFLKTNFTTNNTFCPRLKFNMANEHNYLNFIKDNYAGYYLTINCFLEFFLFTINEAKVSIVDKKDFEIDGYLEIFVWYCTLFRSFKAIENLFRVGYPLDAYGMLRDIKDRAFYTTGFLHGICDFYSIQGYKIDEETIIEANNENKKKILKQRKKTEREVKEWMFGAKSGLTKTTIEKIKFWEGLFHEEVHGSRFSFAMGIDYRDQLIHSVNLGPSTTKKSIAPYINRSIEMQWMIFKTFSYLQTKKISFSKKWHEQWNVLDEIYINHNKDFYEIKPAIASAIKELIDTKFSFTSEDFYKKYHCSK